MFPTPSPLWMETTIVPPRLRHLQGVFCLPSHYGLVVHHRPRAAPLGSAVGKPAGDEAAAIRLRHPAWVRAGDSAPALHAAVLRPAGCRQKCLFGCCAAATESLPSFASQPWTLPSLASQPWPGAEPAGAPPGWRSSYRSGRGPGPTTPGGFSHGHPAPWEGPVRSVRVTNPPCGMPHARPLQNREPRRW